MINSNKKFNLISIKKTADKLESAIQDAIDTMEQVSKSDSICFSCRTGLMSAQITLEEIWEDAVENINSIFRQIVQFGKANLYIPQECGDDGFVSIRWVKRNK